MKLESGRIALITGASRGLGVEISRTLAEKGLDLILAARSVGALEAVAAQLRTDTGRNVRIHAVDMADAASVAALAAVAGEVDVLVNNAGVETTCAYDAREASEIAHSIAINLTGPMLLTHALLPGMIARGRGHIVNIASVAGLMAVPFNEPYCATKFGLVGFTRALRQTALASSWPVGASVVCPGFIDGAGMFETLKQDYGVSSEDMGATPLDRLGPAVIEAIEGNLPDAIVADGDVRQYTAMSIMDPLAFEAAGADSPSTAMFKAVADARRSGR